MARFGRLTMAAGRPSVQMAGSSEEVGFWPRLGAGLIDWAINLLVEMVVILPLFFVSVGGNWGLIGVFAILWLLSLAYGIFIFVWISTRGQTIGKLVLGIKIETEDGDPPGPSVTLLREGFGKLLTLLTLGLGFLFAEWDPHKRALHDHLVRTVVVRSR